MPINLFASTIDPRNNVQVASSDPGIDTMSYELPETLEEGFTQEAFTQQATQHVSQSQGDSVQNEYWCSLIPANPNCGLARFDLRRDFVGDVTFGRNKHCQHLLAYKKVSSVHCRIWYKQNTSDSSVEPFTGGHALIEDLSSNGTYVDATKLGKGNKTILESGMEICFGPPSSDVYEDLRFIFKLLPKNVSEDMLNSQYGGGLFAAYDVRDKIGKGSFATVKRAICRKTGDIKAVKIMQKARFMGNAKTWAMLQREVDIMRSLTHPHIVAYEAYFEDDQNIYIVMDYVSGGDLLDYILKKNGLLEKEAAEMARQICLAVAYLHEQGVCHRDLKPDNILLTSGDAPVIKLTDFGLSKAIDAQTFLKTACGTPAYLAPEVVLQKHSGYSFAVDAWSIGVIVYAILTNTTPFEEDEDDPLESRMRNNRVPDMQPLIANNISNDGQDFIARLLTYAPRDRMSAAQALEHPWLSVAKREQLSSGSVSLLPPNPSRKSMRDVTSPSRASTSAISKSMYSARSALTSHNGDSMLGTYSDGEGYSQPFRKMKLGTNSPMAKTLSVDASGLPPLYNDFATSRQPSHLPIAQDTANLMHDLDDVDEDDSLPFGQANERIHYEPAVHSTMDVLRQSTKRKAPPSSAFSSSSSLSELVDSSQSSSQNISIGSPLSLLDSPNGTEDKGSEDLDGLAQVRRSSRLRKQPRLG